MPFLSHTTAMPGHLAVAVDARSPGRSVSEAFFQAVGVHNPHDRPARQHLDMDLVKNRGKRVRRIKIRSAASRSPLGDPCPLFAAGRGFQPRRSKISPASRLSGRQGKT